MKRTDWIISCGRLLYPADPCGGRTPGYWFLWKPPKEFSERLPASLYSQLMLTGKLWSYLADLNEICVERRDNMMDQMMEAEGVTEELKGKDQMEWLRRVNNIRNRVDEVILNELVYV